MSEFVKSLDIDAKVQPSSEMEGKYLTFWIDGQLFAMPICNVLQIGALQGISITDVPEFPFYAKGIINLRGSIVPIIDVRTRMGKMEAEPTSHTCIIITNRADRLVGCIVDGVNEVTAIDPADISEPPKQDGLDIDNSLLTGMARREQSIILIVNMRTLMGEF